MKTKQVGRHHKTLKCFHYHTKNHEKFELTKTKPCFISYWARYHHAQLDNLQGVIQQIQLHQWQQFEAQTLYWLATSSLNTNEDIPIGLSFWNLSPILCFSLKEDSWAIWWFPWNCCSMIETFFKKMIRMMIIIVLWMNKRNPSE